MVVVEATSLQKAGDQIRGSSDNNNTNNNHYDDDNDEDGLSVRQL